MQNGYNNPAEQSYDYSQNQNGYGGTANYQPNNGYNNGGQQQQPPIREKEIQITGFGQPKNVQYTDRRSGQQRQFTVYYISGNDGITYEVNNKEWLMGKKVGDNIKIRFQVVSNQGNNGQVYTNYRIVIPTLGERVAKLEKLVASLLQGNGGAINNAPARRENFNQPPHDTNPVDGMAENGESEGNYQSEDLSEIEPPRNMPF